jgi:hypothetical protein
LVRTRGNRHNEQRAKPGKRHPEPHTKSVVTFGMAEQGSTWRR